ncbi:MAG: ATP-binding protein [Clostridiales bacterium]|nr:ATP-binding protein [Clostridiales bacterium]
MIKRYVFDTLKEHLTKKEISFIVGPRQAGKTTLMLMLKEYLEKKGDKTLFLNLDIERDKEFFNSQTRLIRKIELELGKQKGFVFIDEIHRKEDAGLFLKGIYDMDLPYKFIVSGSGSVELKEKIHESLIGRKRIFELSTLSFEEFANFKTEYRYEGRLADFFSLEREPGYEMLEEYLYFGGYPRIVLEEKLDEKLKLMNEIYQSYIERDISYLLKVKKTDAFSNLVKIMGAQIGNLANLSDLSSTLGISVHTLKDYLWYLEKTFILRRISPYFRNIRKEITKSSVFYFYDLGLRNFALGGFGSLKEMGFVFQNFVLNILKEKTAIGSAGIHFWRTKEKAEIDFVIDSGSYLVPVEVKYKKLVKPEIPRALRTFSKRYRSEKAVIINLALEESVHLNHMEILFIPFYRILENRFFDSAMRG